MLKLLASSILLIVILVFLVTPQASALPVSFNTTTINLPLSSSSRSSAYDVFVMNSPSQLWMTFDNVITDSSGNAQPTTLTGSAVYATGQYGQAFNFTGSNNVNYDTTPFNYFDWNRPITLSAWVKETGSNAVWLFGSQDLNNFGAFFQVTGGQIVFELVDNIGSSFIYHIGNTLYNDGNWHYIAATYDGSGAASGIKLYADGVLQTGDTSSGGTIVRSVNQGNNFKSGSSTLSGFSHGLEDNLKVYPYVLSASQIAEDYASSSPLPPPKPLMSWYHGTSGSATLTKNLGSGMSTLTISCTIPSALANIIGNYSNIYYICGNTLRHININSGTITHDFSVGDPSGVSNRYIFITNTGVTNWSAGSGGIQMADKSGNFTIGGSSAASIYSNQRIIANGKGLESNFNSTTTSSSLSSVTCGLTYSPTGAVLSIDNIGCDPSTSAKSVKYWNGLNIQQVGSHSTNSTLPFLTSIDSNQYKKLLSLSCTIAVGTTPCTTFILTDNTNTDYYIALTSSKIYYANAQTLLSFLNNHNYAFQTYDIATQVSTSNYELPSPILQSLKLYGFALNVTTSKFAMITIPSGDTIKTTSIEAAIRTIDPRWTNDNTDIPILTSSSSLFPILLTVTNAPVFSAIKVTNPYQIINNQEAVWSIAQLDSTRSVEFDLPAGVCVNVYIADISVAPSIWNFQGIVCATGTNQKTVSYTNTLPFTFWTYPWGVTHSFTPNTNILTTSVHHTAVPYTYTVVLKNSTGGVITNSTITTSNTMDTQTYNITTAAKPVSLYVYAGTSSGQQIYSAFAGSAVSFASVATFFNQYLSYQGFSLLAFIPIVFASMFTRNTVGIGTVLTVLCVATLSWLSVIVIPDLYIYIMIVIAILGMIAYRIYYG